MTDKFYSGFVTIIGKPNVGKSTLLNLLTGEKVSIVSYKPQTTRNKIKSIVTKDDYQIVFIDTPGIHEAKSKLGEYMIKSVNNAMSEVDVLLYLVEPSEKISKNDLAIIDKLKTVKSPIFLVINKMDTVEKHKLLSIIECYRELFNFKEIIPISALKGENTDNLVNEIRKYLPEGPQFFPDDMITDQPERQIVAELIREKALFYLQDEIPHGIAIEIMSMKNREETTDQRSQKEIVDIEATIYCEKDSHKGMIIGKKGEMLKKIGSHARGDIERLLGSKIYLQLWVKIKKDWRDSDFSLRNFGYDPKKI